LTIYEQQRGRSGAVRLLVLTLNRPRRRTARCRHCASQIGSARFNRDWRRPYRAADLHPKTSSGRSVPPSKSAWLRFRPRPGAKSLKTQSTEFRDSTTPWSRFSVAKRPEPSSGHLSENWKRTAGFETAGVPKRRKSMPPAGCCQRPMRLHWSAHLHGIPSYSNRSSNGVRRIRKRVRPPPMLGWGPHRTTFSRSISPGGSPEFKTTPPVLHRRAAPHRIALRRVHLRLRSPRLSRRDPDSPPH
jgi:hypothetical protein